MTTPSKTTPSVYVGTYKKYNEGSLFGAWLDLTQYADKDEFLKACAELHSDEEDRSGGRPEFMFQDHEGINEKFISESSISDDFFEFQTNTANFDDDKLAAYESFISVFGNDDISTFEESFEGSYNSEEDFTYQLVEDCGYLSNVPETVSRYFDYEKFSRDLFITDYHYDNGFVFRNI